MIRLTSGAIDFYLPNPVLGNSVQTNLKTTISRAMSGKIVSQVVKILDKKLLMSFNKLKDTDVLNIISLYESGDVNNITLLDYESVSWTVKLITNPVEFVENLGFYACQLDFLGRPD